MSRHVFGKALAGFGLLAVSPLLAVCAIAIHFEDGGPILFRQRRIGLNGKPFFLLKLRSMTTSAEGSKVTAGGDSRITRIGKKLRDHKLDELPQLWNVFRGDMNFIGPRPEVPEYVDMSDPRWQAALSVVPGITDLASLIFREEESLLSGRADVEIFYRQWLLPRKLDLSIHYARNRSLSTDARLMALTLRHVLLRVNFSRDHIARQFSYGGISTWTK